MRQASISLDLAVPDHVNRDSGEGVGGTARREKSFAGQLVSPKRRKTALAGMDGFGQMDSVFEQVQLHISTREGASSQPYIVQRDFFVLADNLSSVQS